MEHAILILCREIEIVFAILVRCVRCPHLLGGPWHIVHVETYIMDRHIAADLIHGENDIVAHCVLAAEIIFRNAGVIVVAWIDIDTPIIPDMDGRVGREDFGDEWLFQIFRIRGGGVFRCLRFDRWCLCDRLLLSRCRLFARAGGKMRREYDSATKNKAGFPHSVFSLGGFLCECAGLGDSLA